MSPPIDLSALLASWPDPDGAALAVVRPNGVAGLAGDTGRVSRIASISKVVAALAALVAVEEGTIGLGDNAGPEHSTVRHLLAHASGLAFDEHRSIAPVERRRIYSNAGFEQLADHLAARAGMSFADYQHEAVIGSLAMPDTELRGSPAHGIVSSVDALTVLAGELLRPSIIDPTTLAEATTIQYPELRGVVPGLGSFDPNPWGLGLEIRGHKDPHWTAPGNSPATFGHFGGTGTYLWVDPTIDVACVAISGTDFGPWALDVWPTTNQAVVERFG